MSSAGAGAHTARLSRLESAVGQCMRRSRSSRWARAGGRSLSAHASGHCAPRSRPAPRTRPRRLRAACAAWPRRSTPCSRGDSARMGGREGGLVGSQQKAFTRTMIRWLHAYGPKVAAHLPPTTRDAGLVSARMLRAFVDGWRSACHGNGRVSGGRLVAALREGGRALTIKAEMRWRTCMHDT